MLAVLLERGTRCLPRTSEASVATRRLVLAPVLVAIVGLVVDGAPAGASCIGPTIEHTVGPVDRAATIHVVGTGWGDSCYDTGDPPEGVGVLGRPQERIEVVLVQRDVEHVVATGAADAEYGFTVDVPVPDELTAGWVAVTARTADGFVADDITTTPVIVSDVEPPAGSPADDPVTFGPGGVERSDAPAEVDEDEPVSPIAVVVVGAVVVALAAAVVVLFARARQGPSGPRPV